jgi:hypothetical protein
VLGPQGGFDGVASLEQSSGDPELYFFRKDAAGESVTTGQVDFFVDPQLEVTKAVEGWLKIQKRAWRRGREALNCSIPLVISGPPKVRPQ